MHVDAGHVIHLFHSCLPLVVVEAENALKRTDAPSRAAATL
jgi:hypothetical protein